MKEALRKVIDTLTQEEFHGAYQKLLERYDKCIAAGGDYFEVDESSMCILSIKGPIRKKSGNVSYAHRMCSTFNCKPCTTTTSYNSPTNARDESNNTSLNDWLSSLSWHIPKHIVPIKSKNMNAQIAKDENDKFCSHNLPNWNDEYWADFFH